MRAWLQRTEHIPHYWLVGTALVEWDLLHLPLGKLAGYAALGLLVFGWYGERRERRRRREARLN